jgi:ligand-binding SRPBCC domain-containing protein
MGLCVFTEKVDFGSPVEKVFKSLTDTDFLLSLFPPSLGFKLQKRSGRYLGTGCSLSLQARFLGVPLRWVSYVNSFSANRHYSYIWQKSILPCWEHDFYFESIPAGTRVTECILYRFPAGSLGIWFNTLFFQSYLKRIYRNRNEKLFRELLCYNPALAQHRRPSSAVHQKPEKNNLRSSPGWGSSPAG